MRLKLDSSELPNYVIIVSSGAGMFKSVGTGTLSLLIAVGICVGLPGLARSDPALYTGFIDFQLWNRDVPYGALLSGPGLANSPLGGTVSLTGSGPAAFTLPAGTLNLATSLFDASPTITTLDFRSTMFIAENDTGNFYSGGGAGVNSFHPLPSVPLSQFGVLFSGQPNRFGGVMQLLGRFDWRGEMANCSYCRYRTNIPLTPIGGPFGGTATAMTYVGGTAFPPTLVTATVWGFPWDTGGVAGLASVAGTASPTATSAMGFDLRTPSGLGTLQLVSPFLVQIKSNPWDCGGCVNKWFYAGTARAKFHFVPEPAVMANLVVGLGILAVLYRWQNRRTSKPHNRGVTR
jgi:hypothetical protein